MSTVAQAEARALEARAKLHATTLALQARLDPRTVARDAIDAVTDKTERAFQSGADAVRANPGDAAGAVSILAVGLVALRVLSGRRAARRPRTLVETPYRSR